ncbi:hypothetical protein MKW94_014825 [Papaver nudicaule]|uniref:J domain-containing protein n=1 Tax=Papaver nudicaule TaxID=74823 RepID=A0AA41SCZ8_PAPNU|nr:hypothetical protein [Papaver nudicaule]
MQAYLLQLGSSTTSSISVLLGQSIGSFHPLRLNRFILHRPCIRHRTSVISAATNKREQNHYAVLGVSSTASSTDIKRAYRTLARKYHPDVCKDSKSGEVFKSIRLAYDVLSSAQTRNQYDRALQFSKRGPKSRRPKSTYNYAELNEEETIRIYSWEELKKYWQQHEANTNEEEEKENEEEISAEERGLFIEVLMSTLFILFVVQMLGSQLSLLLCSFAALNDKKLDTGYKIGYLIACVLGGRDGILLTLCLSFTSWLCGKRSSDLIAVTVVAMWVGTNLVRYAPLPQGAILTLLYMSLKLQVDLK